MKKVCIDAPKQIVIREMEMPQITAADEVIMKVRYCGICGSDLHIYEGTNAFVVYPRVFGHEFTGEVVAVGENVTNVAVGDHVVGEPIEYCGECYPCKNGHPNVCHNLQVYGVHLDGGCQSYIKMRSQHVFPVDSTVPWECAVLAEPLTIGFQACGRAGVKAGDTVLIQGAGTIGLCAMLAAKSKGARVIITDLFDEKLAYAKKLGADEIINVRNVNMEEAVLGLTDHFGPNVILDAVGNKKSLESSLDLVSAAGRIVELGMANLTSDINHMKLARRDIAIMGTRLQAYQFPEAIRYVEENWQNLKDFVNRIYPAEEVQEAFDFTIANAKDVRKTLLRF